METNRPENIISAIVMAWLSGSMLVSINVVTLRRARLILGWVTGNGQVKRLDLKPATKVDSAF